MAELDDIRSFIAVVEAGGFGRAAQSLGLAKSIVSRRVSRLEEELGTRLLSRTTRGVAATEAGLEFKARSERILAELEEAREAVAQRAGGVAGRLRLAMPMTFGNKHVAPLLGELAQRYPRLEIDVQMLAVDDLLEEVAQSRAHIGLAYNPPPHAQIAYRASSAQPVVLLLRSDHPLALQKRAASVDDLRAWPLAVMPSTFGIGHVVKMLEVAENIELRPALATNSLTALKRVVTAGEFVTLIGEFAAYREIAGGELTALPIRHPLFETTHARLIVKQGRPLAAGPLELVRWIEEKLPVFAARTQRRTRTRRRSDPHTRA